MPVPSDLLRDAEVLRKLLTECLRRIDRLERQLSVEALDHEDESILPLLTDPFEQALPDPAQPHTPPTDSAAIRTIDVSPGSRLEPDELISPRTHSTTHRSPHPRPARDAGIEKLPPSGDGTLDPFALLDTSVPSPEPLDAEIRRGMNALLGGLDVSTPNGE